jgi:hypothetical protein
LKKEGLTSNFKASAGVRNSWWEKPKSTDSWSECMERTHASTTSASSN